MLQYEEHGEEFIDMLDGMFAFVLLDTRDKSFIAARDAIGITPLYIGWGVDGIILTFPYEIQLNGLSVFYLVSSITFLMSNIP